MPGLLSAAAPEPIELGSGVIATPHFAKLSAALARAQGQFGPLRAEHEAKVQGKTQSGKSYSYSYNYAKLADALGAALPALSAEGLSVMQFPSVANGREVTITTVLSHESGEWMRSVLVMVAATAAPQDVGKAITYARRYALLAIVGLAPEDNDAQDEPSPRPAQRNTKPSNANGKRAQDVKPPPPREPAGDTDALEQELTAIRAGISQAKSVEDINQLYARIKRLPAGTETAGLNAALKTKYSAVAGGSESKQ